MRHFLKRVSWYIFISIFCTKIDTQMIKDEKNEMQVVTIMYNKFKIPKHVLLYLWDLTQNMSLMFLQHVSFLLYFAPCTPTAVFVHPWDMADWSQFPLKQRSFDTVDNKALRLSFFNFPLLICKIFKKALDFDLRVISSFRSPFSTLRFSLNIKSLTKQKLFYRLDILHDFSIWSFQS